MLSQPVHFSADHCIEMTEHQSELGLRQYQGKWLTEAEILYSGIFEDKHRTRHEELQAKIHERTIMAERSLKMQQVPTCCNQMLLVYNVELLPMNLRSRLQIRRQRQRNQHRCRNPHLLR